MKLILPKGAIAIKCSGDSKNVPSILTLPGSTIFVIPSSNINNAPNANILKSSPSSSADDLNGLHPLSQTRGLQDKEDAPRTEKSSKNYGSGNKQKSSVTKKGKKASGNRRNTSKNRTQYKQLASSSSIDAGNAAANSTTEIPCEKEILSSIITLKNEQSEKNYSENIAQSVDLYPKGEILIEDAKDNSFSFKGKVDCGVIRDENLSTKPKSLVSESEQNKEFFAITGTTRESIPKHPYLNIIPKHELNYIPRHPDLNSNPKPAELNYIPKHHDLNCIPKSSDLNCIQKHSDLNCMPKSPDINYNLDVGIPLPYESDVCNSALVKDEGKGGSSIEISPNEFTSEIITLPLPSYSQCPQENDIPLYMSPESSSYTLSTTTKEDTVSNLTPFYVHDHVTYANPNDNSVTLPNGDSSSPINGINYFYESPMTTVREYESEAKHTNALFNCSSNHAKDYRLPGPPNLDSSQWFLSNYEEEEEQPRDYSNNSGSNPLMLKKVAAGNEDSVETFVENVKRQADYKESNESYEERRKLAIILLNTPESERKRALKNNFWIVEDEPLEQSIFSKSESAVSRPLPAANKPKPTTPKEYICHVCGKMLKGRSSLRTHIFLHMNYKAYECPYCLRKFTQRSILKNHIRTHTGETPYVCSLCGKAFKTLSIKRKHLIKHSKLREFECCICSKRFKSKIILQSHLKIHLTGPHICRFCKTMFDSRLALSAHVRKKHTSEKKYFCTICNKGYGSSWLLKQHMNVHSNEQKHSCHVCGAAYLWKSGLAAHLRTHSFKIECERCGDKFISLKKLERHRNRHSEPFSHKCSKCDRQFKFAYLLKKHLAKHKDELCCRECGVGFMTKTNLKKHLKSHASLTK